MNLRDADRDVTIVLPPAPGSGEGDLMSLGLDLVGTKVRSTLHGSAAERDGLRGGDEIVSVDGFDVRARPVILRCLLKLRSGARVDVILATGRNVQLTAP